MITGSEADGVLHAGTTRRDDGAVVASGGRVLSVVGTGADLSAAREAAYRVLSESGCRAAISGPTSDWPPPRAGSRCREDEAVSADRGAAFKAERAAMLAFCATLAPADWRMNSRAEGWSIQDVVAHLAAGCHAVFSPAAGKCCAATILSVPMT